MMAKALLCTVYYLNNYHDIALCATKLKNALDACFCKRDRVTNIKQKFTQRFDFKIGDLPQFAAIL